MTDLALSFAAGCFGLALVMNLWRLLTAPTAADRVMALDTMAVNVIALVVLLGMATGIGAVFEVALVIAMVGFVSSLAYARFFLRGNIIE
jgi:multicomponent K+:H+ antiporter subunit F